MERHKGDWCSLIEACGISDASFCSQLMDTCVGELLLFGMDWATGILASLGCVLTHCTRRAMYVAHT